ncbi:MAG: BolA family transcriptional regulator [Beijerinckiaceae bacterium]|nr:BolA family transcriptional regulator [Beijerinckiaceae bacterium]MCI0734659.1 BolA family transcriptional regulator [Beijerinckiaceae bacterium]
MDEHIDNSAGNRIAAVLCGALSPIAMDVIDESHKHAGHAHAVARPGAAAKTDGTHFRIKIVSEAFRGKSRVERHRAVNDLLSAEFAAGLHALAIEAKAPGE